MNIFNFFKKTLKSEKESQKETPKSNKTDRLTTIKLPDYDMNFEYLEMVKNKYVGELFYGNTSIVPMNKRNDMKLFYDHCIKDGWLYETEGNESVVESFTKKDFTTILEENNLPTNGTKPVLVERIASSLGVDTFNKIGESRAKIKITELGKSKLREYKSNFDEQYNSFKDEIFNLFSLRKISEACFNVTTFKESYPFNSKGFFISYSGKELYEKCNKIIRSDILKRINTPEIHHEIILIVMCMYYSFTDFDYKKKLEEIYPEFEDSLISSDLVKNKDLPFIDFQNYIYGPI